MKEVQAEIERLTRQFVRELVRVMEGKAPMKPRGMAALSPEERQVVARKAAQTLKRRNAASARRSSAHRAWVTRRRNARNAQRAAQAPTIDSPIQ